MHSLHFQLAPGAWKPTKKLLAAALHLGLQVRRVVGEVQERGGCKELLSHEQQRRWWQQEEVGGEGPGESISCKLVQTRPVQVVGDLIVILQEKKNLSGRGAPERGSTQPLLPPIPLALIEAVEERASQQLLSVASIVAAKRLGRPGDRHPGGVVKIVDPDRIQPPPALGQWSDERNLLSFALGEENDFPVPGGGSRSFG